MEDKKQKNSSISSVKPLDMLPEELGWRLRVFDSLSFPTLILKPSGMIVAANKVFLEKYSVSQGKIVGMACHEIFYNSPDSCSPSHCPLPKILTECTGHSMLERVAKGDGYIYEDRVFSPILNDEGKVDYIIESIRDVTRTKVLEKELTGIKEFVARVVQSSASAIIAADTNGKILLMNRAAKDLFGYKYWSLSDDLVAADLYPPGEARKIMEKLRNEKRGPIGKMPSSNVTIRTSQGEDVPAEMSAAIIYEGKDNKEVATMGIYNDLRERLRVEKELKETQIKLAQSEKMASMGQLAAGVAHEINNPLTGILFYSSLLQEKITTEDPMFEDLSYIIEDVNRCRDIVKSLLAYTRQSNSVQRIIHMNELVEQSLTLIRDQKVFADIELEKNLAETMMIVNVDTNQIAQVIINLVMNAVDAMDGTGHLLLKTYKDMAAGQAVLEVSDTGHGIPEDLLLKIFDPFFTTKKQGKGTGLGLSNAIGIMHENEGDLVVKNSGRNGTTFKITLPLFDVTEDPNILGNADTAELFTNT